MRFRLVLLAAAAAVLPSTAALAQTAPPAQSQPAQSQPAQSPPPAKPAPAGNTVEGVTVTSARDGMRSNIDRRSYSVANDLQATSGSIGDALRNIPSVEVDVQGNVSLRGDSNVTFLIDGKPSTLLSGDNRADALQQLPADQIERVEVMTNPSAAFRPDGSAGVINLVMKKSRKQGRALTLRGNVGTDGRYNGGVSGSLVGQKLTLSGDVGLRHDEQKSSSHTDRARYDALSGTFVESRLDTESENNGRALSARLGMDYDLDPKTRLSAGLNLWRGRMEADSRERYEGENAAGAVVSSYDRLSQSVFNHANTSVNVDWRRQFKGTEHELTVHAEYEVFEIKRDLDAFTDNMPAADYFERVSFGAERAETDFQVDYTRPMGKAKLKTGYDLEVSGIDYDNYGARGPTAATLVVVPGLTNRFLYDQTVHAAYATYERPFGKLTAQAGLRLEQVDVETDQVTAGLKGGNDYFRAYPTLHLAYELSDTQQLTASYSHRVQRPSPQDLNPYPVYMDPFNLRAGNPNLKPSETHSWELGWQRRAGQTYYLVTAYYRENYNGVVDVVQDLGGGVFLTTRDNLGESRSGGLELVANGKLLPKLTYNASGNVFWNEIDAAALGFTQPRSGTSVSGRINLNWQPTAKDFFQINAFAMGERLTPQGHSEPAAMVGLGYRRKMNDKLTFLVTVRDLTDSFKQRQVIDTPTLRDRTERRFGSRALIVGFTYTLGKSPVRQREPGFEFDGGGGPPGQ